MQIKVHVIEVFTELMAVNMKQYNDKLSIPYNDILAEKIHCKIFSYKDEHCVHLNGNRL